ncbi:hypothetical protein [Nocardia gipuzkoensis]
MTSVTLWFPLSKVLDLAEQAMAAPGHSRSPFDDPSSPESMARVVYALGHGPETHWDHGAPLGDDFAEYLDLTEDFDGHTLIDLIRTYAARNGWFAITVSPRRFEMMFRRAARTLTPSSGTNHRPSRRVG